MCYRAISRITRELPSFIPSPLNTPLKPVLHLLEHWIALGHDVSPLNLKGICQPRVVQHLASLLLCFIHSPHSKWFDHLVYSTSQIYLKNITKWFSQHMLVLPCLFHFQVVQHSCLLHLSDSHPSGSTFSSTPLH